MSHLTNRLGRPLPTTIGVNESELIRAVVRGEPAAERELYDSHVDRVYRLVHRMTGDDELAREFTQDTFIRVFERLKDFRGDSALSTWIHSVAVSVTLNGLRKVKRIRTREVELDPAFEPVGVMEAVEPRMSRRIWKAIDSLSERYRVVFIMHDVEGFTHEEIGAQLRCDTGTSKSQLFRARRALRRMLGDARVEESPNAT